MEPLLGHDRETELLERNVRDGRPAHAYIFLGPEGVGKQLAAIRLACFMNCPEPDSDTDHSCRTCRRIVERKHPDVWIERPQKGMIRVERIRAILEFFKYAPVESNYRVCIVDDSHCMNAQAQNALLKTLEEPPRGRTLILITSKPSLLLPTVRSRCRKLPFGPIPRDILAEALALRGDMTIDQARALAAMSGGSMGRALQMAGKERLALRLDMLSLILEPDSLGHKGVLELSAQISSHRERAMEALEIAASCVRDLLVARLGESLPLVNSDLLDRIVAAAEHQSDETLVLVHDALTKGSELLEAPINVNGRLVTDVTLLRVARLLAGPTFGLNQTVA